ncbi:MAG: alpha/beta fold hydrolase [Myxococcota bacterium]
MPQTKLYFFHGLESGPIGTKSLRLKEEFDVQTPDFEGMMNIQDRLEKAEALTRGESDLVIVGSSFGGLLAALLYARHPERIRNYVLMAPALYRDAASEVDRMPDGAVVIHGRDDDVVPMEDVRAFCSDFDVVFIEVDDGHRLHGALDVMVESVREMV